MKTKNLILFLLFILIAFAVKAQININDLIIRSGNINHTKTGSLTKSAYKTVFLLDSVLDTYYLTEEDSMLYTYDYYTYDDNGNVIEWIHRSTCNYCSSGGNYKYVYNYDEAGNCIVECYYNLDLIILMVTF